MVHRRSMLAGSVAFAALAAGRDLRAQTGQSPLGQSPLGQSQALAPAAKPPSFRLEEAAHFARLDAWSEIDTDPTPILPRLRWRLHTA